jgi:hypothetical protein
VTTLLVAPMVASKIIIFISFIFPFLVIKSV